MKRIAIICFLLTMAASAQGQQLEMHLDSIHPLLVPDQHGDTIRKYFRHTFYSFPTPRAYRHHVNYTTKLKEPYLQMSMFYAKSLAVNLSYAMKKIPELNDYQADSANYSIVGADSYPGKYAIPIFDSTGIIITVNGISSRNADQYEFRVLEDQTREVLPWTKPSVFTKAYMFTRIEIPGQEDEEVAYLGHFKQAFGKSLTFEVRRVDLPDLVQVKMSALWIQRTPAVLGTFTFAELSDFLEMFKKQWKPNELMVRMEDWSSDSVLLRPRHAFGPSENSLIFYLDDIVETKEIIEYNVTNGKDSSGWRANDFDLNFIWIKDLAPGNYTLNIRYSVQRHNICSYPFTIAAAWYQTAWFKLIMVLASLSALGMFALLWRSARQRKLLAAQQVQRQLAQTELKSIRSQFNPHFVFNALSSIQGLVTKGDTKTANQYLSTFSTLMRESLLRGKEEFANLATEIKLMDNYLKLEQLRFGFDYRIDIDPGIDTNAIEVPGLLLQPLIENAIKHGVAPLYKAGALRIRVRTEADDFLIDIQDNGSGFEGQKGATGFGLRLTRERIRLLNSMLDGQRMELEIGRNDGLTTVSIRFENWLL
ncbi:sensor histidine kinase [Parapedobacter composti]|nr:histidine kinase [Parapedobacter composti]